MNRDTNISETKDIRRKRNCSDKIISEPEELLNFCRSAKKAMHPYIHEIGVRKSEK